LTWFDSFFSCLLYLFSYFTFLIIFLLLVFIMWYQSTFEIIGIVMVVVNFSIKLDADVLILKPWMSPRSIIEMLCEVAKKIVNSIGSEISALCFHRCVHISRIYVFSLVLWLELFILCICRDLNSKIMNEYFE
jgi:hypothetical protein